MPHNKVFGYCENLCNVEVLPKTTAATKSELSNLCNHTGDQIEFTSKCAVIVYSATEAGHSGTPIRFQIPLMKPIHESVMGVGVTVKATKIYSINDVFEYTNGQITDVSATFIATNNMIECVAYLPTAIGTIPANKPTTGEIGVQISFYGVI